VKTATYRIPSGRWYVNLSTKGGNQSRTGIAKYFDRERCDYLFAHVGDGRRGFIPTGAIDGRTGMHLGGPKYSEYEVERGRVLMTSGEEPGLNSKPPPGEYRSGQPGGAVNAMAYAFAGSNPASPISSPRRVKPTNYERKPGQLGIAVINQKRRITIRSGRSPRPDSRTGDGSGSEPSAREEC
jgi:hypothetical protein